MRKTQFTALRISLLVMCTFVVFAAAAWVRNTTHDFAERDFRTMAEDSQRALETRMQSYHLVLEGLKGMMMASDEVRHDDVESYLQGIDVTSALPGISGIGFIRDVPAGGVDDFLEEAASMGFAVRDVHPAYDGPERFIIKFVEPAEDNAEAIGLNIAFEKNRRDAAIAARDTGESRLSARIVLVQDTSDQPGFVLLHPYFRKDAPTGTVAERRAAFEGWVYTPFVGAKALADLTQGQGRLFRLSVYDGPASPETLIYTSSPEPAEAREPLLTRQSEVALFGRTWTLQWETLPAFDVAYINHLDLLVLAVGLLLTLMLWLTLYRMRNERQIVERKVEAQTRELTSRMSENESIIGNARVGIVILDGADRVVSANAAARAMLDIPEDGPAEPAIAEIVALPDLVDRPRRIKHFRMSAPTKPVYLDVHANSWTTGDGQVRRTVFVHDVTEQALAASQLEQTEQRLDQALKGSEIGVFDVDLIAGTSVVSETWRKIMGVEDRGADFDTQAYFMAQIYPDDLRLLIEADRGCITGRTERSTTEFRIQVPGKGVRWMRSDAVVWERDENGLALRMIGTQVDITEFRQAQAALKASEDRFRQTFENAPVGKAILDSSFRFHSVNAAMCSLTGREKSELEDGRSLETLVRKLDWDLLAPTLRSMSGKHEDAFRGELAIDRPDGSTTWALANAIPARDPKTSERIYIIQFLDITQSKEVERLKSEFVASVSHELRTPLTSIKGAISLVQSAPQGLPASAGRLLDIAHANVDRLTELVNDILDLEKIHSGSLSFELSDQPALAILKDAQDQLAPLALQYGVQVDLDPVDSDPTILVDRGRMMQVLINLMSNACKYSPKGGTVRIVTETQGTFLRIAVQDDGPGVPKDFVRKLFKPFSQADSSDTREKGGTGLGLSIAYELVQRMGGGIGYDRAEGGPTEFWFTVRIVEADAAFITRQQRAG